MNKDIEKHSFNCDFRPIECPDCLILLRDLVRFPHDSFVCGQIQELRKSNQAVVVKDIGNTNNDKIINFKSFERIDSIKEKEVNKNELFVADAVGDKSVNSQKSNNINDISNNNSIFNRLINLKDKLVCSINSSISGQGNVVKSAAASVEPNQINTSCGNSIQEKVYNIFSSYLFDNNNSNYNLNNSNNSRESQRNLSTNIISKKTNGDNNIKNTNCNEEKNNNINNNICNEKNEDKINKNLILEKKPFNPLDDQNLGHQRYFASHN